jgi:hypothetical protein
MAHTYSAVNTAADTFGGFVTKVNAIINAVSTEVLTANGNANGAVTTGNTFLNGILFANVLSTSKLRGGNVQASGPLLIDSNVTINTASLSIGNSSVNTFANSSYLDVITADITTANIVTATIAVGSVNSLSSNIIAVGNSTVNAVVNSSMILVSVGGTFGKLQGNAMVVGNSTVYATINSSVLSFTNTSGSFSIDAQGSVSQTEYASRFKFANTNLSGTTTQTVDSFVKADYKTCEYVVVVKDNGANSMQHSTVLVASDGSSTTALSTEYATLISNVSLGLFSAIANASHVIFQFTPTVSNCSVSYGRTGVNA